MSVEAQATDSRSVRPGNGTEKLENTKVEFASAERPVVTHMIKNPFNRKTKDDDGNLPSAAFAEYCRDELERRRDSEGPFDEEEFLSAVDLALERLQAMEGEQGS